MRVRTTKVPQKQLNFSFTMEDLNDDFEPIEEELECEIKQDTPWKHLAPDRLRTKTS